MSFDLLRNYKIQLLLIITAGILARLYFSTYTWILPDEGNWLYDAYLMTKGLIPLIDYASTAPLYIYVLSVFIDLFGNFLIVGRFVTVLAEIATIVLVFLIGKELFNKKVGTLSALLYSLGPIMIFWGSILESEPLQRTFVTAAMYFLILGLRNNKILVVSGLFVAAGVLVRLSAGIFLLTIPLFLIVYFKNKNSIKSILIFFIGAAIILVPFFTILTTSGYYGLTPTKELILSNFEGGLTSNFVVNRLGMSYALLKEAAYFIIVVFMFFAYSTNKIKLSKFILASIIPVYITAEFASYFILGNPFNLHEIMISIFILLFIPFVLTSRKLLDSEIIVKSRSLMFFWFAGPLLFYLFYWTWHLAYFTELAAVVSVAAAFVIYTLKQSAPPKLVKTFIVLFILLALFSQSIHHYQPYYTSRGLDRFVDPQNAHLAALHIKENTDTNDRIFSNAMIAFLSERRIIFDISHALLYHYEGVGEESFSALNYPTINEIIEKLESTKYVVVDPGFEEAYLKIHEDLRNFIYSKYTLEKEFGNIQIYRKKQ